ncbi:MAG TPA: nucleotidyl transferase AbiEii/AbiGii toxin family protein [Anaerovoracaceae bacterium]|nr:nucleotidyl transferase AbiEii/AbiGii toxin family protein [Anaerovoracaceae bacterium]
MFNIANLPDKDRAALFHNTAIKCGMKDAIVEKDFWVCWAMNYLFQHSPWRDHFAFKGGTSLSKGYGLIERFSEDIDLILDWRLLNYSKDQPWQARSKTQQDKFNKEIDDKCAEFLRDIFEPQLEKDFGRMLDRAFSLHIFDEDPQTVTFAYPQLFEDNSILKVIRLEIGALAAWTPTQNITVIPYAAEHYPHIFKVSGTNVLTVAPERTFWEKITILHREAFRTNGNFPDRYSRHYYDLFCMNSTHVKMKAFNNLELLDRVATFKSRFYPTNAARYDLAKPGTIQLIPPDECVSKLESDYILMQNMIYGKKPDFNDLMSCMHRSENEINQLKTPA